MMVTLHYQENQITLHVNVPPSEGETVEVANWAPNKSLPAKFIVKNVHHHLGMSAGQTVHIELAEHVGD